MSNPYTCRSREQSVFRARLSATQVEKLLNLLQSEGYDVVVEEEERGEAEISGPATFTLRGSRWVCTCPKRSAPPEPPPTPGE